MIFQYYDLGIRKILSEKWLEVRQGKWDEDERIRMHIYLPECIRIEMVCMRVRNIDRIYRGEFFSVQSHFHCTLHHISGDIVREPRVDKDTDIFSLAIHYIDEKLGMSERSNDHGIFLLGKRRNARKLILYPAFTSLHPFNKVL